MKKASKQVGLDVREGIMTIVKRSLHNQKPLQAARMNRNL